MARAGSLLLVSLLPLLLVGGLYSSPHSVSHSSHPQFRLSRSQTGDRSTQSLLNETELFAAINRTDAHGSATLYYVDENGTWFHAYANGTIGPPAPNGSSIPNIVHDEAGKTVHDRFSISASNRPIYVWKVRSVDGCATSLYNASDGSELGSAMSPGCPAHPTPTEPASASATPTSRNRTTTTDMGEPAGQAGGSPTTSKAPGFGIIVAILALGGFVVAGFRRYDE